MVSELSLDAAKLALKEGRHEAALEAAQALLSEDNELAGAHEVAGFAANYMKRWGISERHWRALTGLQPARLGPYLQTVTALGELNRHKDSLEFIDKAIELSEENLDLEVERIRILNKLGKAEIVSKECAALEKKMTQPEHFTAIISLARFCAENDNNESGANLFNRAKKIRPESLDPDTYLARLSYANGHLSLAKDLWTSLSQSSEFSRPYEPAIFLARIAWKDEDFELVEKHAILAQQYEPHQIEPYTILTSSYFRRREIAKAEAITGEFSKHFPQSNVPALNRAKILEYKGDVEGAQLAYLSILEAWPDDLNAGRNFSEFLKNNNRYAEALTLWETRAKLNPEEIGNHTQIVLLLEREKRWEDVVNYIEGQLLSRDSNHEIALLSVGGALRSLARRDEAQVYFKRGCDLYPANINFWIGFVANLVTADEDELVEDAIYRAERHFQETSTKNLYKLSRLYMTAEYKEKAKRTLERVLEVDPEHAQGGLLLSRLIMTEGRYFEAEGYVQALRERNGRDLESTKNSAVINICGQFETQTSSSSKTEFLAPESIFKEIEHRRTLTDVAPIIHQEGHAIIISSSLGAGGAERQVVATVNELAQQRGRFDNVHVLAEDLNPHHGKDFFRPNIESQGHVVRSLSEMGGRVLSRNLMAKDYNASSSIRLLETMTAEVSNFSVPLFAVLKSEMPEVVHTWQDTTNIAGGFAALLAGVPRIILSTRSTRPDARRRKRRYLAPGYKMLLKRPGVIMLNNSKAGARDYEDWLELPKGTVKTIYNGLDIKAIRKRGGKGKAVEIRRKLGFPKSALVLGGVMRFSEEKRPDLWVAVAMKAAVSNPKARFVIVGDGPMRVPLMERVAEAGLAEHIKFPGAQRPVEPWMSAMDMLFLSSRMEGLPNVLIEAQTLGVPVASTAVGGAPEAMIKNKTGILFTAPNPTRIANSIFKRMNNKQWMTNASEAAKVFVEASFANEVMAARTLKAYKGQLEK